MPTTKTHFRSLAFVLAAITFGAPSASYAQDSILTLSDCTDANDSLSEPTLNLTIHPNIVDLFDEKPLVDGLLEPFSPYGSSIAYDTFDYSKFTEEGGYNVISGKLANPQISQADPFQDDLHAGQNQTVAVILFFHGFNIDGNQATIATKGDVEHGSFKSSGPLVEDLLIRVLFERIHSDGDVLNFAVQVPSFFASFRVLRTLCDQGHLNLLGT